MVVVVVVVLVVVVVVLVVVVITGATVVVMIGAILVVVVDVVVVVAGRVVVVVAGRVVVVVAGRVVVVVGAAVVVVGAAVVVVVAGAVTFTVNVRPPPPPASKTDTPYEPGAALALTRTLMTHGEAQLPGVRTVSGDEAEALMTPTSLVAVVDTTLCDPLWTVAEDGLSPVIAASADPTGASAANRSPTATAVNPRAVLPNT